ncbi:MAG: TenA family transcriptional regulator [Thermoproteus sp. AZ2]|jgi:thiaminase|uniref:TenA family transcriptional regulator n=1 Tax=Thermoproteus sp. AZ2 TaxID=1609232 RepID=A0ACC6V0M5_9CREN|nr:MAG: TenA family transcriptional regulator [Thermoproteus sp. AZ2]
MAGVIAEIRQRIAPLNEAVFRAPAVAQPSLDAVKRFVLNQLYIVPSDLKALSASMHKAKSEDEYKFVKILIDGDYAALSALRAMAEELGVAASYQVDPAAVAYTHFLSWLALNGTMGDLAVAMTVNLPVWGSACAALSKWLKSKGYRRTEFLDAFAGPYNELEALAEPIAERYLDLGRYLHVARAIQTYECLFWYSISGAVPSPCLATTPLSASI